MEEKKQKKQCVCAVEYDENHEPVEVLCDKHREEREQKLRNEYQS